MNSLLQIAMHLVKHGYISFSLCEGEKIEELIISIEKRFGIKSKVVERKNAPKGELFLVNVDRWEE